MLECTKRHRKLHEMIHSEPQRKQTTDTGHDALCYNRVGSPVTIMEQARAFIQFRTFNDGYMLDPEQRQWEIVPRFFGKRGQTDCMQRDKIGSREGAV